MKMEARRAETSAIADGLVHDSWPLEGACTHHPLSASVPTRRFKQAGTCSYLQLPAFRNPAASASDSEPKLTWFLRDTLS